MWDSLVQTARKLLRQDPAMLDDDGGQGPDIWDDFDLIEWPRTRLRLSEENLHALPHSGACKRGKKDVLGAISERDAVVDLVEL